MSRFKSIYKKNGNKKNVASSHLINEHIKANNVNVIDQNGNNLGVIPKSEAISLAQEALLDLVQVGQKDDIVITKIMDYGKFLYTKKKQLSESKKKQKVIQVKEVKLRPNIGDHDYQTKMKRAIGFLKDGKKVKFTLQFRGREFIMMRTVGAKFFERINNDLLEQDLGSLIEEKEQRSGPFWSKIYSLKSS